MKITETNGSFKVVLPKEEVKKLGWGNGTELKTRKHGKKLILEVKE